MLFCVGLSFAERVIHRSVCRSIRGVTRSVVSCPSQRPRSLTPSILLHLALHSCSDPRKENWVCCACYWVGCSRYVEEHMALHAVVQGHMIAMSLGDMYIWCYGCDAYVGGERAEQFRRPISMLKQYGPRLQQMLHQKMAEQGLEPGDLQQKPEEPEDPPAAPDQSS